MPEKKWEYIIEIEKSYGKFQIFTLGNHILSSEPTGQMSAYREIVAKVKGLFFDAKIFAKATVLRDS